MPRETLLIRVHEELAKELAEFAGWRTAMTYSATKREHAAVRASVGVVCAAQICPNSLSYRLLVWMNSPELALKNLH